MRVVFIGGWFQGEGDDCHLRALARKVDLTVYGHRVRPEVSLLESMPVPDLCDFCSSRELDPVHVNGSLGPRFWFYRHLGQALDDDRPDIVHILTEPWQLLALQASTWASKHPETAFVMHNSDRNWWTVGAGRRIARRVVARRTLARADGFVSESLGGVREAQEFGLSTRTVTAAVIANPRDPAIFRPPLDDADRTAARERLGLRREGVGVGFLGRLSREKGPLLFLEAFGQAASHGEETMWAAVAGTGPMEREVAHQAGPNVARLGSLSYPHDVATFLQAIDILVMPSIRIGQWEEQAPRAVAEAMLSSRVVVATPVGGVPEMLGGTGIVVSEATPAALAAGIVRAASDPVASQLRTAAKTRAIDVYSGESAANSLLDVWDRALLTRQGKI